MRTLTRHEKKLTLFLAFAVLAGIHLLGLKFFAQLGSGESSRCCPKEG